MSGAEYPVTQAVRFPRSKKIDFVPYVYAYEEHGGMAHFAKCAGKPGYQVIRTIVLQDEHKRDLVVLIHGDKHISTRNLACELGLEYIKSTAADQAAKWTGYLTDGTSSFGTKTTLPVYVEESIQALDEISVNGDRCGFIVDMKPENLHALNPQDVHVAVDT